MSLYNMICGTNPLAGLYLSMLRLMPGWIPRLRDVFLEVEEGVPYITVLTRTGGGNRDEYREQEKYLVEHHDFLKTWDDSFDSTFAYYRFQVPVLVRSLVDEVLSKRGPDENPLKKFMRIVADMEAGKDTPETKRATEATAPIAEAMKRAMDTGDTQEARFEGGGVVIHTGKMTDSDK